METITKESEIEGRRRKGFIAFICRNIYTLLSTSLDRFRSYAVIDIENDEPDMVVDREAQFRAYVNNRLSVLTMWTQCTAVRNLTVRKQYLESFLHDMEHHFVDPHASRKIRNAYRWIRQYLKVYPAPTASKKDRKRKVLEMIERIYESVEIPFPLRNQREGGFIKENQNRRQDNHGEQN